MSANSATTKPCQDDKLSPQAKQMIVEFLPLYKTIDLFSGHEVRTQSSLFAPGLNMVTNQLHLNHTEGREAYARQYQCTLFEWDTAETIKVQEANEKILE